MQSKRLSLIEAISNTLVGYGVNFTANLLIFPLFGMHISLKDNFIMGLIYTAISIIRGYILRRSFSRIKESL